MSTTILTPEQIETLFREHDDLYAFGYAIEQAVLQSPEVQALRKDAERYRHLRNRQRCESRGEVSISLHEGDRSGRYVSGVDADAAIDAAMEKQP